MQIGEGIKDAYNELGVKREELWITSKLWNSNHRKEHVRPAVEATLKDLGLCMSFKC
jgi:D-xylose reductase